MPARRAQARPSPTVVGASHRLAHLHAPELPEEISGAPLDDPIPRRVAGERVKSYRDSYHGLASQLGSKVVANCASCHGVHNIFPSTDVRSMIHPANLARTCGQCHVGASENFAKGRIHLTSELVSNVATVDLSARGTRIVRWIYLPLIFLTIGGMVLHNLLVWRKKVVARRRHLRSIVRLTVNQRIQHWLLLTSFIALVLSGFALQYPDSGLAWAGRLLFEDERTRWSLDSILDAVADKHDDIIHARVTVTKINNFLPAEYFEQTRGQRAAPEPDELGTEQAPKKKAEPTKPPVLQSAEAGTPDAAPVCVTVPPNNKCGLAPQCGCAMNETCDVTNRTNGATSCVTAGLSTLGRPCVQTGDCVAGH